ncbi:MAG: sigma-70 family RNA polymerase sigma factor [Myxococcales bacterium FL481]|nr:MAG: sigma-70 family RNA polymerase sigma factor [Myxococcales bacterium FL481]
MLSTSPPKTPRRALPAQKDELLLEKWCAGDRSAGETLVDRHITLVHRFVSRRVSSGVADIVQHTFLIFTERKNSYRGEGRVRAFLLGIAYNLIRRAYDRRRVEIHSIDFDETSVSELEPSMSSLLYGRAQQRRLVHALRRLPMHQQSALELYYAEGMTGPEIAAILEVPEGTVRGRIRRGLKQLSIEMESRYSAPESDQAQEIGLQQWACEIRTRDTVRRAREEMR